MNKIFLFLFVVILYAGIDVTLKEVKTFDNKVLASKVVGKEFYIITKPEWNIKGEFKNFFVIDGKEILIGSDKNYVYVKTKGKVIKLKGVYVSSLKKDGIIYIATPHKVYGIDKNLKIIFSRDFSYKIDHLILYKNKIFLVTNKRFKLLKGVGEIDFRSEIPALHAKFYISNKKMFALYEEIVPIKKKGFDSFGIDRYQIIYVIKNLTDNYKIRLNNKPLKLKMIDGFLYVVFQDKIEKYQKNKLLWRIYTDFRSNNIIKLNESIYLLFDYKAYKITKDIKITAVKNSKSIKSLKCKILKETPVLIANFYTPLVVTRGDKYRITLYDEFLNVLWTKEINAKINRAKVIGNYIYLVGIKKGKFWVARMNFYGKILKETVLYKAGDGFDIAKNDNGFVAVGYKYFDHLGDYIKRFVIVLLDKNLNFITDRTYGDFESVGIKVIRVGKLFFGVQKDEDIYYLIIFGKDGFLRWYKGLSFDRYYRYAFYDVKLLNQIFFSTDRSVFVLNSDKSIAKFRDFKNVIKIIDNNRFITDNGLIINGKSIKFDDLDIIDGMYNWENYYFIGYDSKNNKGVVCKY